MQPLRLTTTSDIRHLGWLVGGPNADRIIAVSTSAVFRVSSLPKTYWGVDTTAMDSGFQGHLYTRPNDTLVVRVPNGDPGTLQMVTRAIQVSEELWRSLTGLRLLPTTGQIVMASDHVPQTMRDLPLNRIWHVGTLLGAAAARFRASDESLLAFVLSEPLAALLGQCDEDTVLLDRARATSLLMDKNLTMQHLQEHGVDCAQTFALSEDTDMDHILSHMPANERYVFKPSGGAAGVGVFSNAGRGASVREIRMHCAALRRAGELPHHFQIQQFVSGTPLGVTAYFAEDSVFEILEIHRHFPSEAGRFTGARWTARYQAEHIGFASMLCQQLAGVERIYCSGLICLDAIDRQLIEINPRLTASAPIAHLLARQHQISKHIGDGFAIKQIDLDTKVMVPYEMIENGSCGRLVEAIWKERRVMALPQGLNPFGGSRFVFINDNSDGTARELFKHKIQRREQNRVSPLR